MKRIHINLLDIDNRSRSLNGNTETAQSQQLLFPKAIIVFFSSLLLLTATTTALSYKSVQNEQSALNKTFNAIVSFGPLNQLISGGDKRLVGEHDDRINILLLGIGGKGHEGVNLTDTVLIVSIKPSVKQAALFSIPRDLLIPIEHYGWRKINNANAFGEVMNPGYGGEFTRKTVSDLFQIPIQYYARVDFKAFEELIDAIGELHICVDNSFTDYMYPTLDEKYQAISFRSGCQTMDGDQALKFSRSRHSIMNNEGSDFARSKRQQKILTAVKEKIFSAGVLLNPGKINNLLQTYEEHVRTDLKPWEIVKLTNLSRKLDAKDIKSIVFDDGVDGFLTSNTIDGAYVLQPRDGTFDIMRAKIQNIFTEETPLKKEEQSTTPLLRDLVKTPSPREKITIDHEENTPTKPSNEIISVSVLNGTFRGGLASRVSTFLRSKGYVIKSTGNAMTRDYVQNILIDHTGGGKQQDFQVLQSLFNAEVKNTNEKTDSTADFTLILGNEATQ